MAMNTSNTKSRTLSGLEITLADMRSRYNQAQGQLELLEKQKTDKQKALEEALEDIKIWQQVQSLFGKVSEFARQQLKLRIQETVTAALQAVFEREDIRFEVIMRTVANQPAAEWAVVSQYGDVSVSGEPEESRGGGVSDIVSLALRLALLELARPKPQGPVLLDEIGKHVSSEYAPNVAQFLKQYAEKTGRQVWLITHQQALADAADVSYRVRQENGISEVAKNGS